MIILIGVRERIVLIRKVHQTNTKNVPTNSISETVVSLLLYQAFATNHIKII